MVENGILSGLDWVSALAPQQQTPGVIKQHRQGARLGERSDKKGKDRRFDEIPRRAVNRMALRGTCAVRGPADDAPELHDATGKK